MEFLARVLAPLLAQDGGGGGGGFLGNQFDPLILILVIGTLFYFLILRPEKRKRQETDRMLENLKKNDRVVTIGGIRGVVVNAEKGAEDVTLRVDEGNNTRLTVLRSAISRVIAADDGDKKKDST
ncbi:MAG: preprotein translocase subunit YajC [Pirellulaceae bacterium]